MVDDDTLAMTYARQVLVHVYRTLALYGPHIEAMKECEFAIETLDTALAKKQITAEQTASPS